ncbi:O-methyltransferase [Daejeonella sp.]|uniref:O-methyltransferase n=1 Tax=Daejeonella sp. TaxID=2805397 RepID=UPI0030BB9C76
MELISEELKNYLIKYCDPENRLLKKIDRETNLKVSMPRMLSGHYQGRVLSMLSKMIAPERILEIGTFTGYATLCLAEGLTENGKIHTIDVNAELEDMVKASFSKSPHKAKIVYHIGDATKLIPGLAEVFDIVFIDADKKNNGTYYNIVIDKLRSGGIIIVDNVLWSGKVLEETCMSLPVIQKNEHKVMPAWPVGRQTSLPIKNKLNSNEKIDQNTIIIANFNEMVMKDQRVEKLILPVRDGLFVIRKK